MQLTGYYCKALLGILFHRDTDVLVNLSKRSDVQSEYFILLILLTHIKLLLNVSSVLSLLKLLNQ